MSHWQNLEAVLHRNALAWFDAQLEEAGSDRKQDIRDSKSKWMKAVSKAKKNKKSIAFQKIRSALMQQGIAQSDLPPVSRRLHASTKWHAACCHKGSSAIEMGV